MKKMFSLCAAALVLTALLVLQVAAAPLAGGYYVTGDSALGNRTYYVPADYASGSLTYDSSGNLFNLSSSNIYLYCPDYPDYTIYAPRFSVFQYRAGSGSSYQYSDLNLKNISDTNVEIFDQAPALSLSVNNLLIGILVVLVIGIGAFVILRR